VVRRYPSGLLADILKENGTTHSGCPSGDQKFSENYLGRSLRDRLVSLGPNGTETTISLDDVVKMTSRIIRQGVLKDTLRISFRTTSGYPKFLEDS